MFGHLKEQLVAKGYLQMYEIDYQDIFSPVAEMTSIGLVINLPAFHQLKLHRHQVYTFSQHF